VRILAFFAASEPVSVALVGPAGEAAREVSGGAVEGLVPAATELLRAAGLRPGDLDAVAVARGPGSFTGLRVGAAAALGLARARRIPLFAVGTLDAWAAAAQAALAGDEMRCHVALDARRGEVYLGTFRAPGGAGATEARLPPLGLDDPRALPVSEALARLEPGVPVVGDARDLLIAAGLDAGRPGFARPPAPLALWLARVAAADPAAARVDPLEGFALDYLRQPQAVARAGPRPELGG
jgi:tRNA threonylcarbamoyl adenosine modification protein YeaZ